MRTNASPPVVDLTAGRAALAVAPAIGGAIARFRWVDGERSYDWLRPATADDLASGKADRLACFPLVPFSNRIRTGRFAFGGRVVRLRRGDEQPMHPLHGEGWRHPWQIVDRGADRLTLELERAAGAWPFPYRARQAFALTDDALRVTLTVENCGSGAMPAGLGLHPYFPRTPRCRLHAPVTAMWATDADVLPTALAPADPRLAAGDGLPVDEVALDNAFAGWSGHAEIRWPERGAALAIDTGPPLSFLVVYSPAGERFFCAEPVSHCTDAFNLAAQGRADTGMLTVDAGARVAATVQFRPRLLRWRGA